MEKLTESDYIDKIFTEDCLGEKGLRLLPDKCIDTIITDPPYGIGFMGKEWDTFESGKVKTRVQARNRRTPTDISIRKKDISSPAYVPYDRTIAGNQRFYVWCFEWLSECLRVAKPGATLLVFGGTRTWHRLACAIEDAGWEIFDTIMWIYGSGFPKAQDISKMIDQSACRKELELRLGRKPTKEEFKGAWEGFRKIGGIKSDPRYHSTSTTGYQTGPWANSKREGSRCEKDGNGLTKFFTNSAGEESDFWNGWKTHALKPAWEPIICARKPNEGSYPENALKHGVAGLNMDGGRIKYKSELDKNSMIRPPTDVSPYDVSKGWNSNNLKKTIQYPEFQNGRYPANLILDGSPEVMAGFPLSIARPVKKENINKSGDGHNGLFANSKVTSGYYDKEISASRFFYVAKASRAERNGGCEGLEDTKGWNQEANNTKRYYCKKCGRLISVSAGGRCQCENPDPEYREGKRNQVKNNHPTIKPLKLMEYLCLLTKTPTGGVVLDPFCGSGTTLMACVKMRRHFVGYDIEPEYVKIAEARMEGIRRMGTGAQLKLETVEQVHA